MIEVRDLRFHYQEKERAVLDGVSMTLKDGEYVALIGANGCGKTTLVHHLNALMRPTSGVVSVDGLDTLDDRQVWEIRRRVGMVFQNPENQIVGMTIEEDIAFGPGNLGLPPAEIRRRVASSLELVGLESYGRRVPSALSGGEKRLVAIAGILAMEPRYIIFDEPTSYLDPASRQRVLALIAGLHKRGLGIIHITHNMDDILDVDRVLVMREGKIVRDDRPEIVLSQGDWLRQQGLGMPAATALLWRLKEMGVSVRTDILDFEDACREIAAWKSHPVESVA